METFLSVLLVLSALFLILVFLLQGGNQGGVGAAFGGGNSQGVFGASGATTLLEKLTYGAATTFIIACLGLNIVQGRSGEVGLKQRILKEQDSGLSPATPPEMETSPTPESSDKVQDNPDVDANKASTP